jgi:hypothetical protein
MLGGNGMQDTSQLIFCATRLTSIPKQPTAFTLDTFELSQVWETPELITSLANYSYSLLENAAPDEEGKPRIISKNAAQQGGERAASVLLLRILAVADYFTDDMELMTNPSPVYVDIILDPFLFNLLPESLLPTVGYLLAVAALSWPIAQKISSWLQTLSRPRTDGSKKRQ